MVYGLLRALPGDQACLTPSPALLLADLTPASGRQNDTTWPSASAPFVKGTAASTASRPALMTLANAPLSGRDRANQWSDLGPLASGISENQKSTESADAGGDAVARMSSGPVSLISHAGDGGSRNVDWSSNQGRQILDLRLRGSDVTSVQRPWRPC